MGRERRVRRCPWGESHPLYVPYHDREWGMPLHDDRKFFELLVLEAAQAGLSWLTVLKKRDAFRAAYDGFDPDRVAAYGRRKRARLLRDARIIRNRLKVDAAIENARRLLRIRDRFGSFGAWLDAHHPRAEAEWVQLFKDLPLHRRRDHRGVPAQHRLPARRPR